MSRILWKQALRPSLSATPQPYTYDLYENFDFRIERTCSLPHTDEQIVELPEPRSFRSLNRAGSARVSRTNRARSRDKLHLGSTPFSVLDCTAPCRTGRTTISPPKRWPIHLRKTLPAPINSCARPSSSCVKLAACKPAFLSILGTMGPLYGFTHSRSGRASCPGAGRV